MPPLVVANLKSLVEPLWVEISLPVAKVLSDYYQCFAGLTYLAKHLASDGDMPDHSASPLEAFFAASFLTHPFISDYTAYLSEHHNDELSNAFFCPQSQNERSAYSALCRVSLEAKYSIAEAYANPDQPLISNMLTAIMPILPSREKYDLYVTATERATRYGTTFNDLKKIIPPSLIDKLDGPKKIS